MYKDHERAKHAFDSVNKTIAQLDNKKSEFKSWATKFPGMLLTCGLLQTVAFYETKKDGKPVYKIFEEWLSKEVPQLNSDTDQFNLTQLISKINDMEVYRFAFREAMAYGTWLKRAVSSLIPDKD
ncbi:MAG: type III-B CRISPR module-associated protein Cmr5 [Desulfobacterales bacterium]|nr:type III-B CRISPR module-associated protein Cmr5 [Desulfobacterales bacterium]